MWIGADSRSAGARSIERHADLQRRDAQEGADFLMIKPGMPYLDIISDAAQINPDIPVAVYQVSGEFAMIHAAAEKGVVGLKDLAFESVEGMIRAGAYLVVRSIAMTRAKVTFGRCGKSAC